MSADGVARPPVAAGEAVLRSSGDHWLLDVREQSEWDAGHAPTAHHIPMSVIKQRIGELPDDRQILVICLGGQRSARVANTLVSAGYDAVNVNGGMLAWQAAGGEVVAEGQQPPRV